MTTDDPFRSATDLAAAIRRREVSPTEVAEYYLDRVDRLDGRLNAFCFRADDDVRRTAAAATDAVMAARDPADLAPFLGVPLPVKDLDDVAGWPTSYGSRGADPAPQKESDPIVRRFTDAGFVPLGKTTTSEFGAISFTESEAFGITRNPWDTDRTPGGSSGGSAVAVAAGMAPIAHAADGGGSIRVPASCTGLVGLKPTRGRVTSTTIEGEGLGTSGVVTRTVADAAAGLDVLARHDPAAWWSPPTPATTFSAALAAAAPRGLRVGALREAPVETLTVDPACVTAVDTALRALEAAGQHVVDTPLDLPPADTLITAFTTLWNVSAAGAPLADPDRVEAHNLALRQAARAVDSWAFAEAEKATQALSRRIVESFVAGFDLLVTPTMACLPPPVGAWRAGTEQEPMMALLNCYPLAIFTSIFNVTGLPAISVPLHHDPATGLPVGVQIVAAPWREDLLLQVARDLEQALPWADRHPGVDPGFGRGRP
jgi:amidase